MHFLHLFTGTGRMSPAHKVLRLQSPDADCLSSPRNPRAGAVGPLNSHGTPLRADPTSRRTQPDLRSSNTLAEEGKGDGDVTTTANCVHRSARAWEPSPPRADPSHAGSLRCGCSTHAGAVERVKLGCSDGRAAAPVHCLWVSLMGLSGCPFRDTWVRTWLAYKDCSGLVEQWGA